MLFSFIPTENTFRFKQVQVYVGRCLYFKGRRNLLEVSKIAKIRNRYNQVPHLTQDTNAKVTNLQ